MSKDAWQRCANHSVPLIAFAAALYVIPLYFYLSPLLDDSDFLFYRLALVQFSREFSLHNLYPRWLYGANDGLGSPVFLFLGAGAYYPALLLSWLGDIDKDGTLRFILNLLVARLVYGWLCYRWLRYRFDAGEALLITLCMLLIPFNLHELFVRKEMAGQWAYVGLFASLIGLEAMTKGERAARGLWLFSTALAFMLYVHLPSFVIYSWVPFAHALFLAKPRRIKSLSLCLLGVAFASGLTAFYWLPLWNAKELVNAEHYFTGQYSYSQNFMAHPIEYFCLPYFVFCAFLFWKRGAEWKGKPFYILQFFQLFVIIFMLTPLSSPVWQLVVPLHYIQFPYRFLNMALLPFAIIAAYSIQHLRLGGVVGGGMATLLGAHTAMIVMFSFHADPAVLRQIPDHSLVILKEYRTQWQKQSEITLKKILDGTYRAMPLAVTDKGVVENAQTDSHNVLTATIAMREEGEVLFKRLYMPNVELSDKASGKPLPTSANEEGLLQVKLPAGEHALTVRMLPFKGEKEGALISLVSLLALGASQLIARRRV